MNITVNVDDVTLDSVIGQRYDPDEERRVPETLADACVAELVRQVALSPEYGGLKERVAGIRTEMIRERLAIEIDAALTAQFEVTNHYGERTGKTTTLREEIVRLASEALKLDHRNSFSRELTTAQKVIREEVDRAIAKELADVVAAEKAKVVAAVRAKAAELIATAVKEGVGR